MLSDGIHAAVVFELTSGTAAVGHIPIILTNGVTAPNMAVKIENAINGVATALAVTASISVSNTAQVLLTNDRRGTAGNVPITETVVATGFVVTGMAGGAAFDCGTGVGCISSADCQSQVCVSGVCKAASCNDGVLNANETDVDCGGGSCAQCPSGKGCVANSDCTSGACGGATCQ
jgi:hypothetical protein